MYEDNGLTKKHRKGVYATTKFDVSATETGTGSFVVTINAVKGDFNERLKERSYLIDAHTSEIPSGITVNGKKLSKTKSMDDFSTFKSGWFFEIESQKGILHIKTEKLTTETTSVIDIKVKVR